MVQLARARGANKSERGKKRGADFSGQPPPSPVRTYSKQPPIRFWRYEMFSATDVVLIEKDARSTVMAVIDALPAPNWPGS